MSLRIPFSVQLLIGLLGVGALATSASGMLVQKQSALVVLANPTKVSGYLLAGGQYLIVHDDAKIANGEPCTTFYRGDKEDPREVAVSFHCKPVQRNVPVRTSLTLTDGESEGCTFAGSGWKPEKLTEYQFAGDSEGHGVPDVDSPIGR